ncbi:hypothetical protein PG999_009890 [Apiospora kogelbergensis]|uniref:Hemerythrin-like domain-containing protein n=1 Tax=Apiospora kogelbergensis TaxID=1337665 RepID=A0AAW0QTN9_9PEZI
MRLATRPLAQISHSQSAFTHSYKSLGMRIAAMSTVTEAIIKDHRELEDYYNRVVNSNDADQRVRWGNQFTWELARHSVGEELIVYPAMEKYIGAKGKQLADNDREQHHQVKEMLKEFQNLKGEDPNYVPKLKELWQVLSLHIKEEEREDLPALEQAILNSKGDGESEALAKTFDRTKHFVPSRSHPSAGENPAFESVLGLMSAPIDKLADLFRKFPENS